MMSAPGPAKATPGRTGLIACTAGLLTVRAGIGDSATLPIFPAEIKYKL